MEQKAQIPPSQAEFTLQAITNRPDILQELLKTDTRCPEFSQLCLKYQPALQEVSRPSPER